MSLQDTFIGALAGGAISGIIGFLTTRYDRKLVRREGHLREHRSNLRTIEQAVISLRERVGVPSQKGAEDLQLPRWNKPPLGNWLKKYSITDFVSVESVANDRYQVAAIDPMLYQDIENHFQDLYSLLNELERMTRSDGFKLGELLFEISRAVYEKLSASHLPVLKWTFDKGLKAPLREIVSIDTNESQRYAGAVFLMLIGEDKGNWPNEYAQLQQYGLAEGLEDLAKEIKTGSGEKVKEMQALRERVSKAIKDCLETIEKTTHKMSLKGNCEYL